jgi:hypothetical protein
MTEYICDKCGKSFKRKENLNYHITNNSCKISIYKCNFCTKQFTTANSMYRHMKHNCQTKKKADDEKIKIYERLIILEENSKRAENYKKLLEEKDKKINSITKKLKKIEKEMDRIKEKEGNVINNINNGVVTNMILVGYGKENIDKIDKDEMIKIFKNGFYSTLKLTEAIHFNPKYPEYQNIYISNIKDKYAMMFDGVNWTLTMKEELINKIYEDKKNYIEENLDVFLDSLTISRKKALERWLDTDDDNRKIKEIKNDIKLLLYNKRKMPIDTHKLL